MKAKMPEGSPRDLKIEEVLLAIEDIILEEAVTRKGVPSYNEIGLRAATMIFSSHMLALMWHLQEGEEMEQQHREEMGTAFGDDLRKLIKTYTGLDTHDFYKTQ